jgi:hypothetical protein
VPAPLSGKIEKCATPKRASEGPYEATPTSAPDRRSSRQTESSGARPVAPGGCSRTRSTDNWQAMDTSDGQALRSDGKPWRRPIGASYISWSERRCTACQNRLALGAERVHSAWRDEDQPDFHASLREPKHLATSGLRKWIEPPAGESSRCDACPFCRLWPRDGVTTTRSAGSSRAVRKNRRRMF